MIYLAKKPIGLCGVCLACDQTGALFLINGDTTHHRKSCIRTVLRENFTDDMFEEMGTTIEEATEKAYMDFFGQLPEEITLADL